MKLTYKCVFVSLWLVLSASVAWAQDNTELIVAASCGDVIENSFREGDGLVGGHYYEIKLDAGDKLSVRAEAADQFPDIEIYLLDANYDVAVQSENAGPQEEFIGYPVEIGGLYTLNLVAFRDGTGPYVLSIACELADGTVIPAGDYTPSGTETFEPQASATLVPVRVTLTLFLDENSLTLYVPQADVPVVLSDLAFQVQIGTDTVVRKLADYASFLGLPFDDLPTPICFRLVRAGANSPLPLECQNIRLVLIQSLAAADVFWFDPLAAGARLVTVYQDTELVGICQTTEAGCPIEVMLAAAVATPFSTATLTPAVSVPTATAAATEVVRGYPCEGTVKSPRGSTLLNVVYLGPSKQSRLVTTVFKNQVVQIIEERSSEDILWFYITDDTGQSLGWIEEQYITKDVSCS